MTGRIFRAAFTRDYLDEKNQLVFGDIGLHLLDDSPCVQYSFLEDYHDVVTPEQIEDVDGLLVHYPHIMEKTFSRGADHLTVIARFGAGYDRIDLRACTDAEVAVINAPEAMRLPTASAALMYMLVLAKQLVPLDWLVRKGNWADRSKIRGTEIQGKTLGIIGFGRVGRELARLIAPFGMRIVACDPFATPELASRLSVTLVSLDFLLCEADFVSLHCNLTPETINLIGGRELALMKPSAYLINMARGPIIDHQALIAALDARKIAGAGLDVFSKEPLPGDDPLTRMDNVVLSPHWAANTHDALYNASLSIIEGVLQVAQGQFPRWLLNPQVKDRRGFQKKLARFKT